MENDQWFFTQKLQLNKKLYLEILEENIKRVVMVKYEFENRRLHDKFIWQFGQS